MKRFFSHLCVFLMLLLASNWWVAAFLKIRVFNVCYVVSVAALLTVFSYLLTERLRPKWYFHVCSGAFFGWLSGLLALALSSLVYALFQQGHVEGPLAFGVYSFIGVVMGWSLMLGAWLIGAIGFLVIYLATKRLPCA